MVLNTGGKWKLFETFFYKNLVFSSYKCKTFGKQFNISTGFLYFKTVECQEDKTWTNFDLPCECKNLLNIM